MANFIPEEDREAKATKFEQLKQGNKSVQEYYMEFISLAKHAPHIKTEKAKIRRFIGGLAYHIKDTISAAAVGMATFSSIVGGSTHPSSSSASTVAPTQARGSHNQTGHGAGRGVDRVTQGGRQPRLFSTLDRHSAEVFAEVITGILLVCSHNAYAIIDPGSTFSYVTSYFAINLGLEPEQLSEQFLVSTPVGESVEATRVYRGCIVSVQGRSIEADLIMLEMVDSDVILSMDWLSSCYAMLDCRAKIVRLQFPNEEVLEWKGSSASLVGKFISYLKAQRMIGKGCIAYLAHIIIPKLEPPTLQSVPVVREFPKVFPDDLPGLPPERIIDFGIDLMPGTQPISIPPYSMAPVELNKLRE
ncbi:uncharacterized protein [Nicotiana tomentosiformis]|uniref:uncharacterized protein n=1 Tax=Nicotiana tomentosiformis TaxID=4098 RepID=UPI00388CBC2D